MKNFNDLNNQFLKEVEKLRQKKNYTFTDEDGKTWTGETAIAKHFGMSVLKFRTQLAIAKYAVQEAGKLGFTIIPCKGDRNGRYYIELPDGYRLIYDDDGYQGRYNPSLDKAI